MTKFAVVLAGGLMLAAAGSWVAATAQTVRTEEANHPRIAVAIRDLEDAIRYMETPPVCRALRRSDAEVACGSRFPLRCMRVDRGMRDLRENRLARENCMSGNVNEVLAGFAASLQYDDLPAAARDHCKNLLLDTLACAVAGHRGEETQQLVALAARRCRSPARQFSTPISSRR